MPVSEDHIDRTGEALLQVVASRDGCGPGMPGNAEPLHGVIVPAAEKVDRRRVGRLRPGIRPNGIREHRDADWIPKLRLIAELLVSINLNGRAIVVRIQPAVDAIAGFKTLVPLNDGDRAEPGCGSITDALLSRLAVGRNRRAGAEPDFIRRHISAHQGHPKGFGIVRGGEGFAVVIDVHEHSQAQLPHVILAGSFLAPEFCSA